MKTEIFFTTKWVHVGDQNLEVPPLGCVLCIAPGDLCCLILWETGAKSTPEDLALLPLSNLSLGVWIPQGYQLYVSQ